jgi:beta-galactosidase
MALPPRLSQQHGEEVFLTITFRLKAATLWADAGFEIAWIQSRLFSNTYDTLPSPREVIRPTLVQASQLEVETTQASHIISGNNWTITFSCTSGFPTSWLVNNRELLQSNTSTPLLHPDFWRAPTDNDLGSDAKVWKRWGVNNMTSSLRSMSLEHSSHTDGPITITTTSRLAPPVLAWGFDTQAIHTIYPDGTLTVKTHIKPTGPAPKTVCHISLLLHLNKSFDQTTWFGLGPGEAYADKARSQRIGIWNKTIEELETPWLRVSDARGDGGLRVVMLDDFTGKVAKEGEDRWDVDDEEEVSKREHVFEWGLGRYSAKTLEEAKHPCDLAGKEEEGSLLRVSAQMAGVGTGACGPSKLSILPTVDPSRN